MSLKCYEWINLLQGAAPAEAQSYRCCPLEGARPEPAPPEGGFKQFTHTQLPFSQFSVIQKFNLLVVMFKEQRFFGGQDGFTSETSFNLLVTPDLPADREHRLLRVQSCQSKAEMSNSHFGCHSEGTSGQQEPCTITFSFQAI